MNTSAHFHPDQPAELPAHHLYASIAKRYGPDFALDVEFILQPGITVLFGPSGSGKTTILDCLAGLTDSDAGRITINNRQLFECEPGERPRANVRPEDRVCGYLFQTLALFPHLSVAENVAYGLSQLSRRERDKRVAEALSSFKISHCSERRPAQISGGERQRVALARALVTDPRYLLLDEPMSGLDGTTKSAILEDLRRWNRAHRIPILYVTHDREEVYSLAERVIVLEAGRITAEGLPHEVLTTPARETVAQLAGVENIFDCVVQQIGKGSMTCRLLPRLSNAKTALKMVFATGTTQSQKNAGSTKGAQSNVVLEVPLTSAHPGERLRVGIRAGDILLATRRPEGISARNIIPGTIVALSRRDIVHASVALHADANTTFEVHLTPEAATSLSLEQGSDVWLVIKTHSCHLLR